MQETPINTSARSRKKIKKRTERVEPHLMKSTRSIMDLKILKCRWARGLFSRQKVNTMEPKFTNLTQIGSHILIIWIFRPNRPPMRLLLRNLLIKNRFSPQDHEAVERVGKNKGRRPLRHFLWPWVNSKSSSTSNSKTVPKIPCHKSTFSEVCRLIIILGIWILTLSETWATLKISIWVLQVLMVISRGHLL